MHTLLNDHYDRFVSRVQQMPVQMPQPQQSIMVEIIVVLNEQNQTNFEVCILQNTQLKQFIEIINQKLLKDIFIEKELSSLTYTLNEVNKLQKNDERDLQELGFSDKCQLIISNESLKKKSKIIINVQTANGSFSFKKKFKDIQFDQFIRNLFSKNLNNFQLDSQSYLYQLESGNELEINNNNTLTSLGLKDGSTLFLKLVMKPKDALRQLILLNIEIKGQEKIMPFEMKVPSTISFIEIQNFLKNLVKLTNNQQFIFKFNSSKTIEYYETRTLKELQFPMKCLLEVTINKMEKIKINVNIQLSLNNFLLNLEINSDIRFDLFIEQIKNLILQLKHVTPEHFNQEMQCQLNSNTISQKESKTLKQLNCQDQSQLLIVLTSNQILNKITINCIAQIQNDEVICQAVVDENAVFSNFIQKIQQSLFNDQIVTSQIYDIQYQLENNKLIPIESNQTLKQIGFINFTNFYLKFSKIQEEFINVNVTFDGIIETVKKQLQISNCKTFTDFLQLLLSTFSLQKQHLREVELNPSIKIRLDEQKILARLGFKNNCEVLFRKR